MITRLPVATSDSVVVVVVVAAAAAAVGVGVGVVIGGVGFIALFAAAVAMHEATEGPCRRNCRGSAQTTATKPLRYFGIQHGGKQPEAAVRLHQPPVFSATTTTTIPKPGTAGTAGAPRVVFVCMRTHQAHALVRNTCV